ncbi:hypothetical protein M422DRAFT_252607 [Sphaerobolus stellatus SS14]|uniref:Uncharacterized protein n=1 Tax=Sphaerobolus stellatus (strain SS14) TaxID=990650 RepID=A0A0C9UM22_SPHS4|nr:hypothetical protein M422DRAFT_252607 [Sphaerobolus stellatus SS14]
MKSTSNPFKSDLTLKSTKPLMNISEDPRPFISDDAMETDEDLGRKVTFGNNPIIAAPFTTHAEVISPQPDTALSGSITNMPEPEPLPPTEFRQTDDISFTQPFSEDKEVPMPKAPPKKKKTKFKKEKEPAKKHDEIDDIFGF